MQLCWRTVLSHVKRSWATRGQRWEGSPQSKFPWIDLTIAVGTLILAVGTFVGGIVAGFFLPQRLVIANAAPANPYRLFYPHLDVMRFACLEAGWLGWHMHAAAGTRAMSVVDIGSSWEFLDAGVVFQTYPADPPNDKQGETSYTLNYSISLTGYEMGLQHASDLVVKLLGNCSIMYDWPIKRKSDTAVTFSIFPGENITYDHDFTWGKTSIPISHIWEGPAIDAFLPQRTTAAQFAIVLALWGVKLTHAHNDPWYFALDSEEPIDHRRPPIRCVEIQNWSYRGWTGTLSDICNNKVPNLRLPAAIIELLHWHFGWYPVEKIFRPSSTLYLGIYLPLQVRVDSSNKMVSSRLNVLGNVSASADIRRLVEGTYVLTRDCSDQLPSITAYGWTQSGFQ
ncbi:hypothetical protein BDZ91DRAFT_759458 [Kalaharituber pfeilii]|nr:hypothetical protein BDZ91DRAFT_759458 [Kalaharituber pfeilii]